ncbi:MAG: hypothetical protein H6815_01165 [Phycisphaeraceae bacterium]|nr:hypothetical protein [Phycisphaerales bacterium]MCB9859036.1 hypothetical protein [Phycisphaeraceae bacterium]
MRLSIRHRLHKRARSTARTSESDWNLIRVSSRSDSVDLVLHDDGQVLARNAPDLTDTILDNLEKTRPLLFPQPNRRLITVTPRRVGIVGGLLAACLAFTAYVQLGAVYEIPSNSEYTFASRTPADRSATSESDVVPTQNLAPALSRPRLTADGIMNSLPPLNLNDPKKDGLASTMMTSSRFVGTYANLSMPNLLTEIAPLPAAQQTEIVDLWLSYHQPAPPPPPAAGAVIYAEN